MKYPQLLEGKCYHMVTLMTSDNQKEELGVWVRAADGYVNKKAWKEIERGSRGGGVSVSRQG